MGDEAAATLQAPGRDRCAPPPRNLMRSLSGSPSSQRPTRAEGASAEGELVYPEATNTLIPVLRGRLSVRATAGFAGGHVPDGVLGATGSTGDRGVVVALDVTRARRTGRGLVHGGAIADGVALDGALRSPQSAMHVDLVGRPLGSLGRFFSCGGAEAVEHRA